MLLVLLLVSVWALFLVLSVVRGAAVCGSVGGVEVVCRVVVGGVVGVVGSCVVGVSVVLGVCVCRRVRCCCCCC